MDDKFTTVQQAHEQQMLNGQYLVWTDQHTKGADAVLSITPMQLEGFYKLLLRSGNLEVVPGTDELVIMPPRKQEE